MKKRILFPTLILLAAPSFVFAQLPGSNVFSLMNWFITLINIVQLFFWPLAIALFFWGLVKFMYNAADTKSHEDGKSLMVWGIISFFVLASLWGLVNFLLSSFGLTPQAQLPFVDKNGAVQGR